MYIYVWVCVYTCAETGAARARPEAGFGSALEPGEPGEPQRAAVRCPSGRAPRAISGQALPLPAIWLSVWLHSGCTLTVCLAGRPLGLAGRAGCVEKFFFCSSSTVPSTPFSWPSFSLILRACQGDVGGGAG